MERILKWFLGLFIAVLFSSTYIAISCGCQERTKPHEAERPIVTDLVRADMDIYNEALNKSNAALCDNITSREFKYACRAIVTGNPDNCYPLVGPKKIHECTSRFYMDLALREYNPKLCMRISDKTMHDSCILKFAVATRNRKLCERLSDKNMTSTCESRI